MSYEIDPDDSNSELYDDHQPDEATPNYERETAIPLFDVVCLASEYAEKLADSEIPFKIDREFVIPELLLADSLHLPEDFRTISTPLSKLSFSFIREYPEDISELTNTAFQPVLEFMVHAEFNYSDSEDTLPAWRARLTSKPNFRTDTTGYSGAITPVSSFELPDPGEPYEINASSREMSDMIKSILRFATVRATESDELIDPSDPLEALKVERILKESLSAKQLLETKYRIKHDGLDYTVTIDWDNEKAESVSIKRHNGSKIIIENDDLRLSTEDDVFEITMTTLHASVHTYIESDKSHEEDIDELEQINMVMDLLQKLLSQVPNVHVADKGLDRDADPSIDSKTEEGPDLSIRDIAEIERIRHEIDSLGPDSDKDDLA